MSLWRVVLIGAFSALTGSAAWAQVPATSLGLPPGGFPPPAARPLNLDALPRPAIPFDASELVTGDAQPIDTAEERAAAITLLTNARARSNVRAHAYDLKTSFTSLGNTHSDGNWNLEDISPGANIYRWTAQGPSYSATYLYLDKLLSSNEPSDVLPLRLAQVRGAIFFIYPWTNRFTAMRSADVNLNGIPVRCILLSQTPTSTRFTGPRNWRESEYCVDTKTGLLATYSPAPGLYIHYDYTKAFHFHDKVIPGSFTISEAGHAVIEAKTEGVTDAVAAGSAIFSPNSSGLHALGVGLVMNPPAVINAFMGSSIAGPNVALQMVVLHGMRSPDGNFSGVEILTSTDESLNQTVIDKVSQPRRAPGINFNQPGTLVPAGEVIFTYTLANPSL